MLAVFVFLMNKLWATINGFGQTGAAGDAAVIHLSIFMFSKLCNLLGQVIFLF